MSQVGQLRHQITLQGQGTTRDSGGGISSGWSSIASVYADIKPKTGKEVGFLRCLQKNMDLFVPESGNGLLVSSKLIDELV